MTIDTIKPLLPVRIPSLRMCLRENKEMSTYPVSSEYHSWLEVEIPWHLKALRLFSSVSLQQPADLISVLAEPEGSNVSITLRTKQ